MILIFSACLGSRITGYIVERREVGAGLWMRCNEYNVTDLNMTISGLTDGREYEFRVFAVNAAGKSEPANCDGPVKIQEVAGGQSPEFIKRLINTSIPRGKQLVLECEATGIPAPTPRWLRNGREIQTSVRIKQEVEGGVFRLTITDMQDGDDGDYTCQAHNAVGNCSTNARIRIGAPPRIDRCPNELYLPEGENTKIKIVYTGDQPMDLIITKDGVEIKENNRIKVTIFDDYFVIFIKELSKDDAGSYTLTLRNESGSASANFQIYITGLPGPPIGPLDVSDISKHMCTLKCKHLRNLRMSIFVYSYGNISKE